MIHSSLFSNDESSAWDPKHIKQCLCISEDQLNVLCNIPGWSQTQEKNYSDSPQLESGINSQASKTSEVGTLNEIVAQKKIPDNLEKWSHHAKNVLHSRQLKVRKRTYSFPFETNKIVDDLVKCNSLKRTLSAPDIFQNTVYLEFSYEFINQYKKLNKNKIAVLDKAYTESSVTSCGKENIVSYKLRREKSLELFNPTKESAVGCSSEIKASNHTVFSIFKDSEFSELVTKTPNPINMEVATQLPIAAIHTENNLNNKSEISENNAEKCASTDDNSRASKILNSNSANTHILLPSAENNTVTHVSKNDNSENLNNNNTDVSVSNTKQDSKHKSDIVGEKTNEIAKNVSVSENKTAPDCPHNREIGENASSSNTNLKIHLDNEKIETSENKFQKLVVSVEEHIPELSKVISDGKSAFKVSEVSKRQDGAIVNPCISSKTNIHLENDIIHDKSKSAEIAIPSKRKSESKTRSSKKRKHTREKQGQAETRNVKNASNICYSTEEIRCMLDILKQFL